MAVIHKPVYNLSKAMSNSKIMVFPFPIFIDEENDVKIPELIQENLPNSKEIIAAFSQSRGDEIELGATYWPRSLTSNVSFMGLFCVRDGSNGLYLDYSLMDSYIELLNTAAASKVNVLWCYDAWRHVCLVEHLEMFLEEHMTKCFSSTKMKRYPEIEGLA